MDISKSGLRGSVISGVEAEAQSSMNTGCPAMLVDFGEREAGPNLHESRMGLVNAQNSIVRMISKDTSGAGVFNYEHLEVLSAVNDAIIHGINYLEYLDATLKSIRKGLFADVE